MTESNRATSEQEKTSNVDPLVRPSDEQRSASSSPVGVYDQVATSTTTSMTTSSSNMMGIILLIVLIIVAFFILRQWM